MTIRHRAALGPMVAAAALAALAASLAPAAQAYTAFEDLPTNLNIVPETMSHHGTGGPVLADDFAPVAGGFITKVEWWGSAATDNRWEIVFNTDDPTLHQPNVDNPNSGGLVKYGALGDLIASGVQDVAGHPDIFHYTANLAGPLYVGTTAGTEYWFTVANFTAGWYWADALSGPTVGSESYNAHVSTGVGPCGDGGPHCGPWSDVHQDFAFRITQVPEPGSVLLAGLALGVLGFFRRAVPGAGPRVLRGA